MKKITYKGEPGYHPGARVDLVPGEMEVTDEQAEQLAPVLNPSLVKEHADKILADQAPKKAAPKDAPFLRTRADVPREDKE